MPIRTTHNGGPNHISVTNEPMVISELRKTLKESSLTSLLLVIAETLDAAGNGQGVWISIGKNKAGNSYLLTYHDGPEIAYATGGNIMELAESAKGLLEGP